MTEQNFNRQSVQTIGLIGLGLIAGSFSLALQASRKSRYHFVGYSRKVENREASLARGLVHDVVPTISDLAARCDVIMIAVPMLAMPSVLAELADCVRPSTIITDAGSVKGSFVAACKSAGLDMRQVVPGHPIAGTEKSGVEAGFAELYRGRRVVLTPHKQTSHQATEVVMDLWQACGAEVDMMAVEQHDRVLAATSHLPHMLAFALVDTLITRESDEQVFRYAAGGFKDFSRIASSDPVMWRDIALANKSAVLDAMRDLQTHFDALIAKIENDDGEAIVQTFANARDRRDDWLESFLNSRQ